MQGNLIKMELEEQMLNLSVITLQNQNSYSRIQR